MQARFLFSFARTSSSRMVKIEADQPRTSVCWSSITVERPLRSSSRRASSPEFRTPIRAETRKMPPTLTARPVRRKGQLPWSPPTAPASMARIRPNQKSFTGEPPSTASSFAPTRKSTRT